MTFTVDYKKVPWVTDGDTAGFNRMSWRAEQILAKQKFLIEGKRVLDLACNNGRLSYACMVVGAKSVTGVEARQELIDQGTEYFSQTEFAEKMEFVRSDIFDFLDRAAPRDFDVVLCLGFLYHTVRQVDFFRACKRLSPEAIIVDTHVARNYFWYGQKNFGKAPALFLMGFEDPKETRNTTDLDGIVLAPTTSFLEAMFRAINYRPHRVPFRKAEIRDWSGLADYRSGHRAAYFATRE